MTKRRQIEIFPDATQLAKAAADFFAGLAESAIADHGRFSVALSGGNSPRLLYETLASGNYSTVFDWPRVHIFFGDERCVPPTDQESNFRMVNDALISRVPIPRTNVHRIKGEIDPVTSAADYEKELRSYFRDLEWPEFDLVLLGLGTDGHTASLFPETAALNEIERWVVANYVDKLQTFRISLTLPAINAAQNIAFLVTGQEKASTLEAVLEGSEAHETVPAKLVDPVKGAVTWFADTDAARLLKGPRSGRSA